MSNRDGITAADVSHLEADQQILFIAVKAEFDTETIYLWSGNQDLTFGSDTYIGVGTLLSVSDVSDSLDLASAGVTVTLAGMDADVLNLALTEDYQNRFITISLGHLSGGTNNVVGTMILFKGRMTAMTINDDPQGSTIIVECENRLIDLERPSNLRYTNASQRYIDADDTCFSRVAALQDRQIFWGRTAAGGGYSGPVNPYPDGNSPQER